MAVVRGMWLRVLAAVVCLLAHYTVHANYHTSLELCERTETGTLTFRAQQSICLVRRMCPDLLTQQQQRYPKQLDCVAPDLNLVPTDCGQQTFYTGTLVGAPPPVTCPFPSTDCQTAGGKRIFMITYGPPGAGKSGVKNLLLQRDLKNFAPTCVYEALIDDIVTRIPGYANDMAAAALPTHRLPPLTKLAQETFLKPAPKTADEHLLAAHRLEEVYFGYRMARAGDTVNDFLMALAFDSPRSIVYETTGRTPPSWLLNHFVDTQQGAAFEYWVVFTLCQLDVLLKRVAERARAPGSDGRRPSDAAVREAYVQSQETVFVFLQRLEAAAVQSRFTVFDTTTFPAVEVYDSVRCAVSGPKCGRALFHLVLTRSWLSSTPLYRGLVHRIHEQDDKDAAFATSTVDATSVAPVAHDKGATSSKGDGKGKGKKEVGKDKDKGKRLSPTSAAAHH